MLGEADLVAFVATTDMDRARGFFAGVLGLRLVEQTGFACVFDAQGTQLRVTAAREVVAAPYTVLGWQVDDVEATVGELSGQGVEFVRYDGMEQDELGIWRAPSGARVAWFRDPDGNTLSISQGG